MGDLDGVQRRHLNVASNGSAQWRYTTVYSVRPPIWIGNMFWNMIIYDDIWWLYNNVCFFPATYFQTKPLFWGETPKGVIFGCAAYCTPNGDFKREMMNHHQTFEVPPFGHYEIRHVGWIWAVTMQFGGYTTATHRRLLTWMTRHDLGTWVSCGAARLETGRRGEGEIGSDLANLTEILGDVNGLSPPRIKMDHDGSPLEKWANQRTLIEQFMEVS